MLQPRFTIPVKIEAYSLRIVIMFTVVCLIQCQQVEETKPKDSALEGIRSEIEEQVLANRLASVSVGVYRKGEISWKESFGWADKENEIESTTNTVYALGSLSKSITGTLAHILADKNELSLNDTLAITSTSGLKIQPTIEQLLQMEGGISHQYKYYSSYKPDSITKDFNNFGFVAFHPGSVYHYSNLSYGLIDQFISNANSGQSLHEILHKELFLPLSMTMSYGDKMRIPADAELAKGYFDTGEPVPPVRFEPRGGGGFYSSVSDLLEYGKYHLYNIDAAGNQLMKEGSFASMHESSSDLENPFYCNGWANLSLASNRNLLLSNGAIAGASTSMILVPQEELVVVCLSNTSVGNSVVDDFAMRIAGTLTPDFTTQLESAMEKLEYAFEPGEYKAMPMELGTWEGSIYLEGDMVPITLTISGEDTFKMSLKDGFEIRLNDVYREQGLVIANIEGIDSIGNKLLSDYYMELRLQFFNKKGNGVLFLNSKEDLPSGLPFWVSLTKKE